MRKWWLTLLLVVMWSAPIQAAEVWLGEPFLAPIPFGNTSALWVPIRGRALPADLIGVGHLHLVTTGSVAVGEGGYYGNVWPNHFPNLPTTQTQTHDDEFYPGEWFVSVGYSNAGPDYCGLARSSGMLGAFRVTGIGTIRLDAGVWHFAEDCVENRLDVGVIEAAVIIDRPIATKRTTWGRVKEFYR